MHRLNRLSSLKFQRSRVLPLYSPNSFSFSTAATRLQDFKHQLPIRGTDEKGQEVILSHVKSLSKEPLINMTIGRFFDAQVARYGDQSVLRVIHQNIDWSWKQLQREIDRLALGLLNLGLKPGDRVGVWLPNTYEWVMCQIATAKAGFVLVNINPAYRSYELQYALNLVDAKALIFTPSFKSSNYVQILQQLIPSLVSSPDAWSCDACPALRHLINIGPESVPGVKRFDDILAPEVTPAGRAQLNEIGATLSPMDAQNIQFTSGTTGRPKGATLTHHGILNNGYFIGKAMCLTAKDSLCIPVPLYHCFGLVLGNLAALCHGSRIVYPTGVFDALAVMNAVQQEKCTALHGVPTMFVAMLNHPNFNKFDFSSLRTGIMAGSSCPAEIMRRVMDAMHMKEITICYGMTETSPVSFQTGGSDSLIQRVETVGRVHDHVEAKVVDANGRTVLVGQRGHLLTKGYIVMKSYWNNPLKTAESIKDGWMHTGDAATIDAEGFCRIVGRMGDMIIRGGENIYPREIEEFLYSHPAISDVQVVGLPDPVYQEEVCAWIIVKRGMALSEAEIRAFCKKNLSHFKIPRYIKFVEEFPLTVTGKVQKFVMREQSMKEYNLRENPAPKSA